MMRVLFIDPISHLEHCMFNSLYINDLVKSNCEVDVVIREGHVNFLSFNGSINKLVEIPDSLFEKIEKGRPFRNRVVFYNILRYIKRNIVFDNYDYVIFSSYEEFSFLAANFSKKCYLVNHNNLSGIDNFLKKHLLKKLSKKHRLAVFQERFKTELERFNISSLIIPHGLPPKFVFKPLECLDFKNKKSKYKHVVFSPSKGSIDPEVFKNIIENGALNEFLKERDTLFILRGDGKSDLSNILVISQFLSQEEYEKIFLDSDIIFLGYGSTFKNRVSGIFLEALSNNKKILASYYMRDNVDYIDNHVSFFKKSDEIPNCIDFLLNEKGENIRSKISEMFSPNILHNILEDENSRS